MINVPNEFRWDMKPLIKRNRKKKASSNRRYKWNKYALLNWTFRNLRQNPHSPQISFRAVVFRASTTMMGHRNTRNWPNSKMFPIKFNNMHYLCALRWRNSPFGPRNLNEGLEVVHRKKYLQIVLFYFWKEDDKEIPRITTPPKWEKKKRAINVGGVVINIF